jgi:Fusaric acid resistance protein-like
VPVTGWSRDLFKIAPGPPPVVVAARVAVATGLPLFAGLAAGHVVAGVIGAACALLVTMADIGTTRAARAGSMAAAALAMIVGGTIGAKFGGTTYADEGVVLAAAAIAGWVSGSHPAIAAIARFGAIATAAGAGLQFGDPAVAAAALAGGALAIAVTLAGWWITGVPAADNAMDWRAGLRLALAGANAGPWFAVCYAAACALALFAAGELGVARPYWATVTVMMVMRREGLMSVQLVIHYMAGTLVGILVAAAIEWALSVPFALALLATAFAAFARFGMALNPGLGFAAFTVFFMLAVDLAVAGSDLAAHVLSTRFYDVAVGCVLALAGTLAVRAAERRPAPG